MIRPKTGLEFIKDNIYMFSLLNKNINNKCSCLFHFLSGFNIVILIMFYDAFSYFKTTCLHLG